MCLAIVKPQGATIDWNNLFQGYTRNNDGCGFAFARKGEIVSAKGLLKWNKFKKLAADANSEEVQSLIHFRLATHGGVRNTLCHPFVFEAGNKEFALIHNGVFSDITPGKDESDTSAFVKEYMTFLFSLSEDPLHDERVKHIVSKLIGSNKVAVLDSNGAALMWGGWNGSGWDRVGDSYYSNLYWRSYVSTPATSSGNVTSYNGSSTVGYGALPCHYRQDWGRTKANNDYSQGWKAEWFGKHTTTMAMTDKEIESIRALLAKIPGLTYKKVANIMSDAEHFFRYTVLDPVQSVARVLAAQPLHKMGEERLVDLAKEFAAAQATSTTGPATTPATTPTTPASPPTTTTPPTTVSEVDQDERDINDLYGGNHIGMMMD